jgi:hypothetical protein
VKEPKSCYGAGGVQNNFEFGPGGGGVPLKDNSFSVTDVFGAGVKIAISGTFTSTSHVQGTITGIRVCGSDTYSITLPISASPCALFVKAGVAAKLSLGQPAHVSYGGFNGAGGNCTQDFGAHNTLNFSVGTSLSFVASIKANVTIQVSAS